MSSGRRSPPARLRRSCGELGAETAPLCEVGGATTLMTRSVPGLRFAEVLEDRAVEIAPLRPGDAVRRGVRRVVAILEHRVVVDRVAAHLAGPLDVRDMPLWLRVAVDAAPEHRAI